MAYKYNTLFSQISWLIFHFNCRVFFVTVGGHVTAEATDSVEEMGILENVGTNEHVLGDNLLV